MDEPVRTSLLAFFIGPYEFVYDQFTNELASSRARINGKNNAALVLETQSSGSMIEFDLQVFASLVGSLSQAG